MKFPDLFFIFDVESIGLHGEGFAVAGGVYQKNGAALWEFSSTFDPENAAGVGIIDMEQNDRTWVRNNIPVLGVTHRQGLGIRMAFWQQWQKAKREGAVMAVECGWPVEANFLEACIRDQPYDRAPDGPYPLLEISTLMLAAGIDPMTTWPRTPSEEPRHNPLADARLSARLLATAIARLEVLARVEEDFREGNEV